MNYKKIAGLLAVTFALWLGLTLFSSHTVSAAGTDRYVANSGVDVGDCSIMASPCMTINYAIGQSNPGDTIHVAAGTYNEQVGIIKDNLTLLGAQAGNDARNPRGAESIIDNACGPVQFHANQGTLDGFTVQGSTLSDPCFISGIWMNPGFDGKQGGNQVLNNIVQNNISGIELDNDGTFQTKVQNNLIRNNNNPGPGSGNGVAVNFGLKNGLIDNNRFSGHANSSVFVASVLGLGSGDQNVTVSNNELVGGTPERILFGSVSTGSITGNVSIGSTATNGTLRLFGGNSNITIDCNLLLSGQRGIRVDDIGLGPNSAITAHNNNLQGNVVAGMQVDAGAYSPGILNAESNWWGNPTGPTSPNNPGGTGDALIDPDNAVDFFPFLLAPSTCTPDACPTDPNKVAPGTCGCGQPDSPGCTTDRKSCHQFVEQEEKNFNDGQKADKKNFDDQQKAAKKAFDATHPSPSQRKAFDDQQKTDKKNFDDQQKAAKDAFQVHYKAEEQQCNQLPK